MPHDGVIRVEDLLRSPALQLRLVAGEPGVSRRVAWAHVSELEDPTPWLFGSEMIMTTGIAIARSAARQRAYLERLDDAGVACLALSEQLSVPPLTRAFLDAAGERGFAVVEVPLAVPFMAISQEVAAAVQVDTGQRLNAQLQVFGAVRWLAAGDLSTREIFARLERLSGYRLYACTTGRARCLTGFPSRRRTRQGSYRARRPARRRSQAGTCCRCPGRGERRATSWQWRPLAPRRPGCRWCSTLLPSPPSSCRCRRTSGKCSAVKGRKPWRRCSGACWTRPS